jgi:YtxH-like protein
MKLSDVSNLSKEDIFSVVGLASKRSTTERVLGALGFFGVGLLVGAGAALLLAPKSGQGLREDIGKRLRQGRNGEGKTIQAPETPEFPDEVRG